MTAAVVLPTSPPVLLAGHTPGIARPWERPSLVRSLPAETKLIALVGFALVVVAAPAAAWPVLLLAVAGLVAVAVIARVPFGWALRRAGVELPFLVFALLMPIVATGERVQVGPLSLSAAGLVGGALVLARATLGVGAALVLAASTPPHEIIEGLGRLRLPRALVDVLTHMIRFLDIVADDLRRQGIAQAARGDHRSRMGRLAATAASAGHLFVRCVERGERLQLAMLSRGYRGALPPSGRPAATAGEWGRALALPVVVGAVLLTVLVAGSVGPLGAGGPR
ncbi:cobalt ECF transporter T component CbiQ [Raineyella sp. W15-4]|uniref:cobalt ECF transporter T component CbiQ n=1 Tax=Raineyella sp. W15-4 TaxID=3081651 RepID=UPI0029535AC6|nr:cobalt ECF transporter T component CbiQ [Raineyella sp. W15-4]WOQ17693.1 cobalt ECF transporter T component CbiQ [Raineyella sp. W15-4]